MLREWILADARSLTQNVYDPHISNLRREERRREEGYPYQLLVMSKQTPTIRRLSCDADFRKDYRRAIRRRNKATDRP